MMMSEGSCSHVAAITTVKPAKRRECDECVKIGARWARADTGSSALKPDEFDSRPAAHPQRPDRGNGGRRHYHGHDQLPSHVVMKADDLVDAAIASPDLGEQLTIPSLPDTDDWEAYQAARQNLIPKLSLRSPAVRYGVMAT